MARLITMRSSYFAASALLCALLLAACGTTQPVPDPVTGPETCNNGRDDNGDGKADCADPKCFQHAACIAGGMEVCGNDVDDDGDLAVDCDDSDCDGHPVCSPPGTEDSEPTCSNGQDDDGDLLVDCDDPSCAATQACHLPGKENCQNLLDDDGDGLADCADSNCAGQPCGAGCLCEGGKRTEENCGDGIDNDGEGQTDCKDADCATSPACMQPASESNCGDGIDNDSDGQKDCADADCSTSPSCGQQNDGAPCLQDSQCKSGKCLTEVVSGNPGGMCSNAVSCNVTSQTGCNGGTCFDNGAFDLCLPSCQGASGCRPGYACYDPDANASTSNSYCLALCTRDAHCTATGQGPEYGCNLWSNYCEQKDKGLGKYGAPCTSAAQCESYFCSPYDPLKAHLPGGYCLGFCNPQDPVCGGDGVCVVDTDGDAVSECADGCGSTADCRGSPYSCMSSADGNVCWCLELLSLCNSDSDCCSGHCYNGLYCAL